MKKKRVSIPTLDVEEQLCKGNTAPTIHLNDSSSLSVVVSFLRDYRGRLDLAEVVARQSATTNADKLERCRNLLLEGKLDDAALWLARISNDTDFEKSEWLLENTRLLVFRGDFERAEACATEALRQEELSELGRMTCLQLRAHSRIALKRYEQAIEDLRLALTYSELFPFAGSAFSTQAFLVQAWAESGNLDEAKTAMDALFAGIDRIDQDELWLDRLLTGLRAESKLLIQMNSIRTASVIREAIEVAKWIGDGVTLEKCYTDLAVLAQGDSPRSIFFFKGWAFLPERDLILSTFPKKIARLTGRPILKKVLTILCEGPQGTDELFEKVWPASYHEEKHGTHLRVTLSNLRKLLPPNGIQVEDGVISLV